MEIFKKNLHSYAMYCRKEMVKLLKCYLIPKKVMALCLRVQFFLANAVFRLCRRNALLIMKMHGLLSPSWASLLSLCITSTK